MSKKPSKDLLKFLKPFSPEIQDLALWLREFAWDNYPDSNELIYDNYNALAFGWSLSDKQGDLFCSIAMYGNQYVHFGFYRGADIPDYDKILEGNGKQYPYIKVSSKKDFPKEKVVKLLQYAHTNSLARLKDNKQLVKGKIITKMISAKKKRPKKESKNYKTPL
jgi:hypothetical protein